jgi:peptide/nickel transport system substrate-binding protein
MKKFRWQLIIIFLTGLVVGALLLSEQPTPTAITNTPVPETGGIYTEALIGSMQRLNPVLDFYNQPDQDVDRLLYSSLLKFDTRGLPQPDVAEAWGVSQDGTVYNFTLRDNAQWQDGQPLTSEDIQFTVDLLKNGGSFVPKDLQALWKDVEVIALSDKMVQFRLPEAFAPFQDYLTFGILPKHIFEGKKIAEIAQSDANLKPVGSGPYRVNRILTDNGKITGVSMTLFDKYYAKKPFIEQFEVRYFPDSNAAWQAYKGGQVQGVSTLSKDVLPEALANPNISVYSSRMPQMYMVMFNLKDQQASFLSDTVVRQALMTGLNRKLMVNRILNGQGIIADGPIQPESWAFYGDITKYSYSTESAQKILQNDGYVPSGDKNSVRKKGDSTLAFELLYPEGEPYKSIATQIGKDWASIGVQVTATELPYEQLSERLDQRSYQAALVMLNFTDSYDPDPYPFWDQAQMTGGQNYTQWNNRMASEFVEQARTSVDLGERIRMYRNFQVLFSQELPALPLFYPVYSYGVDKSIQGISVGPLSNLDDRFATVSQWFLVSKKPAAPAAITPTANPK